MSTRGFNAFIERPQWGKNRMKLITRADFDGVVCAVLLQEVEHIESVEFAHPKDIQDGKIRVESDTILSKLPYVAGCGMWFHHLSGGTNPTKAFRGACNDSPSASRVIYDHYAHQKLRKYEDLVKAADKVEAADFTEQEITDPKGWILLSFLMDPRTGLGKFHHFTISNQELLHNLVEWMTKYSLEDIFELPAIKERVVRYMAHMKKFEVFLKEHSYQQGRVVVTDTRGLQIPAGNRFLIHVLFPSALIALRIFDGLQNQFVVIAAGYNIFDKSAKTDLGKLLRKYGGGGFRTAAACQVPYEDAEVRLQEIMTAITINEQKP